MTTLVTGGTGFLAEGLLKRLDTSTTRILARSEKGLIATKQQFPEVEIMTGDICDPFVCQKALKGIETVYHLAAFKHVGLAEKQPVQCVQSNLIGTFNLLKYFRGDTFLAISTDKAAQVSGVYGASKYLMERVIAEYDKQYRHRTKYRVVRYGNVLYSTGSVLCKWKDLMLEGKEVTITDPEATRFFWTVEQAVDLIFECIEKSTDATPYIPEMKAIRIGDLLSAMRQKYGMVPIKEIGLQPGENKHETMDGVTFSNEVEQYTVPEIIDLI